MSNTQSRGSPFTSLVWTHLGPVGSVIIPILQIPIGTPRLEEGLALP